LRLQSYNLYGVLKNFFALLMQKYAKKFTSMDFKVYLCSGFLARPLTLINFFNKKTEKQTSQQ